MLRLFLFILAGLLVYGRPGWAANLDDFRQSLRQQMEQIRQKIDQYEGKVQGLQGQKKTLTREINLLDNRRQSLELKIEQTELTIGDLNFSIDEKSSEISKLEQELNRQKAFLGEYLRTIYQYDQENLLEIILKQNKFSDFFEIVNSLEAIQGKVSEIFQLIKNLKNELEKQKNSLEEEQDEQNQLQLLQGIQKKQLEGQKNSKKNLLTATQGQENKFQNLIAKGRADIEAIRNQLFSLDNVGISMTLANALKYADVASGRTGVRPAFLLAILKKESSWGTNVGTGSWRKDMHPRDFNAFLAITSKLGLDPDVTPVSRKPSYGWGGAMGPAQFLPSVWLIVEEEVANLTGHQPPSPWNLEDAFTATAVKVKRAGAAAQTYEVEWKAAMIYFAGGNWAKPAYRFYGDSVMELAQVIQEQIDLMGK